MWSLAEAILDNLEQNEMDRTSQSYLPLLLILENTDNIFDILGEEDRLTELLLSIMEHLMEEQIADQNCDSCFSEVTNF